MVSDIFFKVEINEGFEKFIWKDFRGEQRMRDLDAFILMLIQCIILTRPSSF